MKKSSSLTKRKKSTAKKKPIMRHSREGAATRTKRKPIMRYSREG